MKQILKVTLVITSIIALFVGGAALATEPWGYSFYIALMIFGSYFFPVLLFVAIYHFLLGKRQIHSNNTISTFLKGIVLSLISLAGLFIWAVLEGVFFESLKGNFWKLVWEDYKSEYLLYLPITLILAFAIPWLYYAFTPKKQVGMPNDNTAPLT